MKQCLVVWKWSEDQKFDEAFHHMDVWCPISGYYYKCSWVGFDKQDRLSKLTVGQFIEHKRHNVLKGETILPIYNMALDIK